MKKKVLITSILTLVLCLCLIAGSTYALFTSEKELTIDVTSGKVDVEATINTSLKTWSLGQTEPTGNTDGTFVNGGVAQVNDDGVLVISRMTPGDCVKFTIDIKNSSDVAVRYKVKGVSTLPVNAEAGTKDLTDALVCTATINGTEYVMSETDGATFETVWFDVVAAPDGVGGEIGDITVTLNFPNGTPEHDNPFQSAKAAITFVVEAVQGNGVGANGQLINP